ncbi:unnamed protein product [Ranitomeya imitator]|uniref:Transcription factor Elf N-terminal domain-containing protein n=1 Tax=Ranitomeya imitator TaxID=111125 RepID=A0ABN9LNV7_9NEOB|nr:unnamed protein product [Ranitomeya imitator]
MEDGSSRTRIAGASVDPRGIIVKIKWFLRRLVDQFASLLAARVRGCNMTSAVLDGGGSVGSYVSNGVENPEQEEVQEIEYPAVIVEPVPCAILEEGYAAQILVYDDETFMMQDVAEEQEVETETVEIDDEGIEEMGEVRTLLGRRDEFRRQHHAGGTALTVALSPAWHTDCTRTASVCAYKRCDVLPVIRKRIKVSVEGMTLEYLSKIHAERE